MRRRGLLTASTAAWACHPGIRTLTARSTASHPACPVAGRTAPACRSGPGSSSLRPPARPDGLPWRWRGVDGWLGASEARWRPVVGSSGGIGEAGTGSPDRVTGARAGGKTARSPLGRHLDNQGSDETRRRRGTGSPRPARSGRQGHAWPDTWNGTSTGWPLGKALSQTGSPVSRTSRGSRQGRPRPGAAPISLPEGVGTGSRRVL